MRDNISVSVVVPVYNASAYLEKCINGILSQTLNNFELILVDDGSSDGSADICDSFSKDERVTIIHQRNSGPAAARNAGIKAARGEYIGFVDADDTVSPEMFKTLYEAAVSNDSDMVFCDYMAQTKKGDINVYADNSGNKTYDRQEILKLILPYFFGYDDDEISQYKSFCPFADYTSYVWLCIYKTSVIKDNNLLFPDQKTYYNEDHLFNLNFVFHASRITHVAKFLYCYRDSSASLTKRYYDGFLQAKLNRYAYLNDFIALNKCGESYYKRLKNKICIESINIINYYVRSNNLSFKQKYKKVREIIRSSAISDALDSLDLRFLPFSKLRIFLRFEKLRACAVLFLFSKAYGVVRK